MHLLHLAAEGLPHPDSVTHRMAVSRAPAGADLPADHLVELHDVAPAPRQFLRHAVPPVVRPRIAAADRRQRAVAEPERRHVAEGSVFIHHEMPFGGLDEPLAPVPFVRAVALVADHLRPVVPARPGERMEIPAAQFLHRGGEHLVGRMAREVVRPPPRADLLPAPQRRHHGLVADVALPPVRELPNRVRPAKPLAREARECRRVLHPGGNVRSGEERRTAPRLLPVPRLVDVGEVVPRERFSPLLHAPRDDPVVLRVGSGRPHLLIVREADAVRRARETEGLHVAFGVLHAEIEPFRVVPRGGELRAAAARGSAEASPAVFPVDGIMVDAALVAAEHQPRGLLAGDVHLGERCALQIPARRHGTRELASHRAVRLPPHRHARLAHRRRGLEDEHDVLAAVGTGFLHHAAGIRRPYSAGRGARLLLEQKGEPRPFRFRTERPTRRAARDSCNNEPNECFHNNLSAAQTHSDPLRTSSPNGARSLYLLRQEVYMMPVQPGVRLQVSSQARQPSRSSAS